MKRLAILTFLFLFLNHIQVLAQGTPTYFFSDTSGRDNAFPLNSGFNRVQNIYAPGIFKTNGSTGDPAPKAVIDTLYFKIGTKTSSSPAFTDFKVRLGQGQATSDHWTALVWDSSLTTVFYASTYTITVSQGDWLAIPLQSKFVYDPSKSLVFELSISSGSNCAIRGVETKKAQRLHGTYNANSPTDTTKFVMLFGMDFSEIRSNDAGIAGISEKTRLCEGNQQIYVDVSNSGKRVLDSVQINWTVNDTGLQSFWYTSSIDTQGGSGNSVVAVLLGSDSFIQGVSKYYKIWTSNPNGVTDSSNWDDTLYVELRAGLTGFYEVGVDFAKVSEAAEALNQFGVCGPVEILIDQGTYNEQVEFDGIKGTSAINSILIHGEDRNSTIISHDGTDILDMHTILVRNVDHLTIRNLTIKAEDSTYSAGIHLVSANHCTIDSCTVILPDNSFSFSLLGIVGNGTAENGIAPGDCGEYNTISNNLILGGYYAMRYTGISAFEPTKGNNFYNNEARNYFRYGLHLLFQDSFEVSGNTMISNRGPDVNGLEMNAVSGFVVEKNVIRGAYWVLYGDFWNYYYHGDTSYVRNNMISTYGAVKPNSTMQWIRKVKIYNNSFHAVGATGIFWRNMQESEFQGNIVTCLDGSILIAAVDTLSFTSANPMDHNVFYAPQSAIPVLIDGVGHNSLSAWFSSDSVNNQNSYIQDPLFANDSDLHVGTNAAQMAGALLMDDIDGEVRCLLYSTIGADEVREVYQNSYTNPYKLCAEKADTVIINPPAQFAGTNYGTTWTLTHSFSNIESGTTNPYGYLVAPSGTGNGVFYFLPSPADADSGFVLDIRMYPIGFPTCYSQLKKFYNVVDFPSAYFEIDHDTLCSADSIHITSNEEVRAYNAYITELGNGDARNNLSFAYKYAYGGTFVINRTASNDACSDTYSDTVFVGHSGGAKWAKGTLFQGSYRDGTLNRPDVVCPRDTLEYFIKSPKGFADSMYNSQWVISDIKVLVSGTTVNLPVQVFTDAQNAPYIQLSPGASQGQDTLELMLTISSQSRATCDSVIRRIIYVSPTPQAQIYFEEECIGAGPFRFYDSSKISSGFVSASWNFGDGSSGVGAYAPHQFADTGAYEVTLRIISDKACKDEAIVLVEVHANPDVQFDIQNPCTDRMGRALDQSNTTDGVLSRHWILDGQTSGSGDETSFQYSNTVAHELKLIVVTQANCMDSASTTLRIYQSPLAQFEYDGACIGQEALFSAAQSALIQSYLWKMDGQQFTGEQTSYAFNGNAGSSYDVELIVLDTSGNCSDTISKSVTLRNLPHVGFRTDIIGDLQRQFIPDQTAGHSFKWWFGDGDSSLLSSPVHTFADTTVTYTTIMQVRDSFGCQNDTSMSVDIFGLGIPVIGTPGAVRLYPNPSNGTFTLQVIPADALTFYSYAIIDARGRTVYSESIDQTLTVLNLSIDLSSMDVEAGVYNLVLETETGRIIKSVLFIH